MQSDERLKCLQARIRDNLFPFDLLLSFFVSALNSFRHDTLLRPFPPNYLTNQEEKDFEKLKTDVSSLSSLEKVASGNVKTRESILRLFYWLFDTKKFKLKLCDKNEFQKIKEKVGSSYKSALPSYVFEVEYSAEAEEKYEGLRAGRCLLHAFHGSRLENFHSILHHGLSGTLNKTALFGEGTYLSSELSLCLDYSPYGHSWGGSVLGAGLSCVAVCQMIDCEFVKCQASKLDAGAEQLASSSTPDNHHHHHHHHIRKRTRIEGSIGGDVPDKYYIVTNDDVIRLKYLLVYASRQKGPKSAGQPWYVRHAFMLALSFYFILLLSIGLHKSPHLSSFLFPFSHDDDEE